MRCDGIREAVEDGDESDDRSGKQQIDMDVRTKMMRIVQERVTSGLRKGMLPRITPNNHRECN